MLSFFYYTVQYWPLLFPGGQSWPAVISATPGEYKKLFFTTAVYRSKKLEDAITTVKYI